MNINAARIMKVKECKSVRFHGKDEHGDTIFVDVEGGAAQEILKYLQQGIESDANLKVLTK